MSAPAYAVERIPFHLHWQEQAAFKETYAGALNQIVVEGQFLKPVGSTSKTILVFMHPTGTMNLLPMPNALAAAGIPCMTCASRYPHNDSALIMEKVILDLGQYIKYAKEKLGFEKSDPRRLVRRRFAVDVLPVAGREAVDHSNARR